MLHNLISYITKTLNNIYIYILKDISTYFYDMEPHQDRALWTHHWGVNNGYMTPPTKK